MQPKLATENPSDLLLDAKALKALIEAVRHQLATWSHVQEADVGEDDFADLQNDILYMELLLNRMEQVYGERYGVKA